MIGGASVMEVGLKHGTSYPAGLEETKKRDRLALIKFLRVEVKSLVEVFRTALSPRSMARACKCLPDLDQV